jgi:hypothetical protein
MSIDIEAKQFSIPAVAEAAGCPRTTLDAWRNRLHLFTDTVTGTKEEKLLSLTDACVARAVKVLTDTGINAADAVSVADDSMRDQIMTLLSDAVGAMLPLTIDDEIADPSATLFGFHLAGPHRMYSYIFRPDEGFAEMMAKTGGVMIVSDVTVIIHHVLKALKIPASRKGK